MQLTEQHTWGSKYAHVIFANGEVASPIVDHTTGTLFELNLGRFHQSLFGDTVGDHAKDILEDALIRVHLLNPLLTQAVVFNLRWITGWG